MAGLTEESFGEPPLAKEVQWIPLYFMFEVAVYKCAGQE